ncbi:general stress protein [Paenibacillus sp. TRM 82003]|nr:general stress protein [Paenibacillus sp. TRM 82003]
MQTQVKTVETVEEARKAVNAIRNEGYIAPNIYVLAHEEKRTDIVSDVTGANQIGVLEEGAFTAMANLFRNRGDELRAKMRSVGVSKKDAEMLEAQMDEGRIIVIATGGNPKLNENGDDPNIKYQAYIATGGHRRFGGY